MKKKSTVILFLLAAFILLSSCVMTIQNIGEDPDSNSNQPDMGKNTSNLVTNSNKDSLKNNGGSKPVNTGGSSQNQYDLQKINEGVVKANNSFAFDIFRKMNEEEEDTNLFISPFSISAALTMTYNGAAGNTKQQMSDVLKFGDIHPGIVNESFQNLLASLSHADEKVRLDIGNSVWVREGEAIQKDFLETNSKYFNAFTQMLDFSKADSAQVINGWISDATRQKIQKMIDPPIPPEVVMYLINAIYFKGEWANQFDEKRTFDGKFKTTAGQMEEVRMMTREGKIACANGSDYKAVRLPYGNGRLSMVCVLPDEAVDIDDFIGSFDAQRWNDIDKALEETDGFTLFLPRFKIEYGIKQLNDSLIELGMKDAFSANADFSGIREGLFISEVLHKAVIEVNEEGSEAAAATVVVMEESFSPDLYFIAERPFLFMIADEQTGTILFLGKLCHAS